MTELNSLYETAMQILEKTIALGMTPEAVENTTVSAILTDRGNIYTGLNGSRLQNGVPSKTCSEYEAITAMMMSGENRVIGIVSIAFKNRQIVIPCESCRELICRINPDNITSGIMTDENAALSMQMLISGIASNKENTAENQPAAETAMPESNDNNISWQTGGEFWGNDDEEDNSENPIYHSEIDKQETNNSKENTPMTSMDDILAVQQAMINSQANAANTVPETDFDSNSMFNTETLEEEPANQQAANNGYYPNGNNAGNVPPPPVVMNNGYPNQMINGNNFINPQPINGNFINPVINGNYNNGMINGNYNNPMMNGNYNNGMVNGNYNNPIMNGNYNNGMINGNYNNPMMNNAYGTPQQMMNNGGMPNTYNGQYNTAMNPQMMNNGGGMYNNFNPVSNQYNPVNQTPYGNSNNLQPREQNPYDNVQPVPASTLQRNTPVNNYSNVSGNIYVHSNITSKNSSGVNSVQNFSKNLGSGITEVNGNSIYKQKLKDFLSTSSVTDNLSSETASPTKKEMTAEEKKAAVKAAKEAAKENKKLAKESKKLAKKGFFGR